VKALAGAEKTASEILKGCASLRGLVRNRLNHRQQVLGSMADLQRSEAEPFLSLYEFRDHSESGSRAVFASELLMDVEH
jgi:hypothetical protein